MSKFEEIVESVLNEGKLPKMSSAAKKALKSVDNPMDVKVKKMGNNTEIITYVDNQPTEDNPQFGWGGLLVVNSGKIVHGPKTYTDDEKGRKSDITKYTVSAGLMPRW